MQFTFRIFEVFYMNVIVFFLAGPIFFLLFGLQHNIIVLKINLLCFCFP